MKRIAKTLIPGAKSRILILPDCHFPNHDPDCIDLVIHACKDIGITQAISLGDLLDFYSVSRWEKDASVSVEVGDLGDEIRSAKPLFDYFNTLPDGWIWLEGNHEVRYKAFISKIPALRSVGMDIKRLLNSVDPSILAKCHYYTDDIRILLNPSTVIEHGHLINESLKPRAEYLIMANHPEQTTIIGHTHKIYNVHKTIHTATGAPLIRSVYSVGHLSDENKQNYAKEPKWQQGFMVITVYFDNMRQLRYDYHQVIIEKDAAGRPSFTLWGKEYK